MLICLYDSSFEGLLTVFFNCYQNRVVPESISFFDDEYQTGLDCEIHEIETDPEKARRVEAGIIKALGDEGLSSVLLVFCSGAFEKSMVVFRYLLMVFKFGKRAEEMLSDERIIDFNTIHRAVGYEIQRMKGFVRFRAASGMKIGGADLDGNILYAPISPDNNIIDYMTEYFSRRNEGTSFIIHDTSRNLFGMYNGSEWQIVSSAQNVELTFGENEKIVEILWKQYFNTVSIASRKNKRLQDNFLPRRYRKYLNEFDYL